MVYRDVKFNLPQDEPLVRRCPFLCTYLRHCRLHHHRRFWAVYSSSIVSSSWHWLIWKLSPFQSVERCLLWHSLSRQYFWFSPWQKSGLLAIFQLACRWDPVHWGECRPSKRNSYPRSRSHYKGASDAAWLSPAYLRPSTPLRARMV